jgi:hypothetical protein
MNLYLNNIDVDFLISKSGVIAGFIPAIHMVFKVFSLMDPRNKSEGDRVSFDTFQHRYHFKRPLTFLFYGGHYGA